MDECSTACSKIGVNSPMNVTEYLDHYLASETPANFALQIVGPWGAGKTTFIKKYLDARHASGLKHDPLVGKPYLYASLNGVRNVSQISEQFFRQLHPVLSSKPVRALGAIIGRGLSIYSGTEVIAQGDSTLITDMATKLHGQVLVFDDLERAAMPIAEAMGFINEFVEHEKLKVVVLTSEKDVPSTDLAEYCRKKEKLFGKTIAYKADPELVFGTLVDALTSSVTRDLLEANKSEILRVFEQSEKANFRTLKWVISDFARLISALDPRLGQSQFAVRKLLQSMVALALEYRAGAISPQQIGNLGDTYALMLMGGNGPPASVDTVLLERLMSTYSEVEFKDPIVAWSDIAAIFENGYIDVSGINGWLANHVAIAGPQELPAWRLLWNWSELPRSNYADVRSRFIDELNDRAYLDIGDVLHAAGIAVELGAYGDNLFGEVATTSFFEAYIADLQEAGTLEVARFSADISTTGYLGLTFTAKDHPTFREIRVIADAAVAEIMRRQAQDFGETFLARVAADPKSLVDLLRHGPSSLSGAELSYLRYVEIDGFVALLLSGEIEVGRVLGALAARYEDDIGNGRFQAEHAWVTSLIPRIYSEIARLDAPHRAIYQTWAETNLQRLQAAISQA